MWGNMEPSQAPRDGENTVKTAATANTPKQLSVSPTKGSEPSNAPAWLLQTQQKPCKHTGKETDDAPPPSLEATQQHHKVHRELLSCTMPLL